MKVLLNTTLVVAAITACSFIFEHISKKIKIQRILLELALGILIASTPLVAFANNSYIGYFAVIGSFVLLFSVGFGSKFDHLKAKKKEIIILASGGVIFPFIFVAFALKYLGVPGVTNMFISAATVSTSVGITARILLEKDKCDSEIGNTVLGASVLDDVYGLVLLAILVTFIVGNNGLLTIPQAILKVFVFFSIIIVTFYLKKWLNDRKERGRAVILAPFSFTFPFLASALGFSSILGSYFSGLLLSELGVKEKYHQVLRILYRIFVPIFFVTIGLQLNLSNMFTFEVVKFGLILVSMILLGQLLAGLLLTQMLGLRKALATGLAMMPRGEVALVIASMGYSLGVINKTFFSALFIMIFLIAIIMPILLPAIIDSCEKVEAKV